MTRHQQALQACLPTKLSSGGIMPVKSQLQVVCGLSHITLHFLWLSATPLRPAITASVLEPTCATQGWCLHQAFIKSPLQLLRLPGLVIFWLKYRLATIPRQKAAVWQDTHLKYGTNVSLLCSKMTLCACLDLVVVVHWTTCVDSRHDDADSMADVTGAYFCSNVSEYLRSSCVSTQFSSLKSSVT